MLPDFASSCRFYLLMKQPIMVAPLARDRLIAEPHSYYTGY